MKVELRSPRVPSASVDKQVAEADFAPPIVIVHMPSLFGGPGLVLTLRVLAGILTPCIPASLAQIPAQRIPATSVRMPAEGNTFPYKTSTAFGGLHFEQPVQVVFAPGDSERAFVVERGGRVLALSGIDSPVRTVFLDLVHAIGTVSPDHGLLSIAFHPRFQENGFVYAWYSIFVDGQRANRLARFRAASDRTFLDRTSETPLITQRTGLGGHDGGIILFGPDGYLYLSLGDGDQNLPEIDAAHQRIDRGFFGGVIRIDVDQLPGNLAPNPHPSVHPGTYSIPADNPFIGATSFNGLPVTASSVRTEWWAVGLRNPWRMSFDAEGRLWCADVGLVTREEINLITRGANYGWDYREGLVAGPRTNPPAAAQFTDPIHDYSVSQGVSITGGFVYQGERFAELAGTYLFADFVSGRIWSLTDDGTRPVPASRVRQIASETGITGVTLDPRTGDILFADFDSNTIKRLVANPNAGGTALPQTLADTGIFTDTVTLAPAAGVIHYTPNASFWSDYAKKIRWFALTDTTSTFGFSTTGSWRLPAGAVWIKHFDLELRRGIPESARRVETRVLVKTADGVYGASYRWNDGQTNATLVAEGGGFQSFTITTAEGATHTQTWTFPSRDNCITCHTERGGEVLSFNTRQLNRAAGSTTNQLSALAAAGYLDISANALPAPSTLPALADPTNAALPLETRTRAYLEINCAQCHRPGGTALGAFDARASTPLSLAGIINGPLASTVHSSDRVIVPGNSAHSILLRRMAGDGIRRMPPVGSSERDHLGETLVTQWIAELAASKPPSRLLNLAARAQVGLGADVLIPGFVIAGAPRRVLVRAIGPSLTQFGVEGALGEPVLSLYDADAHVIATNTRWSTATNPDQIQSAADRLGAFPIALGSADSAMLVTLMPGAYTAHTAGANDTSGVALVEVYDDSSEAIPGSVSSGGKLINTAVRAVVGTGSNILIPGIVVSDGEIKTVLIRAVGPTLGSPPFNVPGTLAEPVVTLFAGAESFVSNTGWNRAPNAADIRSAAARVGAFPLPEGSRDSAMLVDLSPGAYTVQVSGAGQTNGVALVEVYEVP